MRRGANTITKFVILLIGSLGLYPAHAEFGINFPPPAGEVAQEIYDIHMLTMRIATGLLIIVFSFVFYSLYHHRKSRGYKPDQNFHHTWFGDWSWIIVPALVLGVDLTIASSANSVLKKIWEPPRDVKLMDIKVTGHQWWWEFDYLDHNIKIESRYTPREKAGEHYLRDVDHRLVLPTHTKIRFLHTSADVLHAFWVPEIGFKKDAIPGYITETWTELNREGLFRGQCAELCGTWHSRMPIVVEAVSPEKFATWVKARQESQRAAAAEASAEKTWSRDALMVRGKALYETKCAACHLGTGLGLPPAFPPLKGSAIATGPVAKHLEVVIKGRAGTAMQAWGSLNDLDIASILTYERNAWGNDSGDMVQPADVKQAR